MNHNFILIRFNIFIATIFLMSCESNSPKTEERTAITKPTITQSENIQPAIIDQMKKDIGEENVKILPKEYVKRWIELEEQKKQNYIKNNIIGTWSQIIQVGFKNNTTQIEIVNRKFKTEHKQKGDQVNIGRFMPSNGETRQSLYTTHNIFGNGKKDDILDSPYFIENDIIKYPGEKTVLLPDIDQILYISKNLCVRRGGIEEMPFISYYAKFDDGVLANYKEELAILLKEPQRDKRIKLN